MFLSVQEQFRLQQMSLYEKQLRMQGYQMIAGVDEAGRGPLAGPVVAAACILPEQFLLNRLDDSKKLSVHQRDSLYEALIHHPGVFYGIGIVEPVDIDRINILQATFLAMQQSVFALPKLPDYLLIDGNQLPKISIPAKVVVKGDSLSLSIAAASILAKVTRDRILEALDLEYPLYGFKKHKGYGTADHLKALALYGPCKIHRKSFEPIKSLLDRLSSAM
jgi:ribonuclease HII